MADFGKVHGHALAAALHALQVRPGDQWQIILREPLGNVNEPGPETCTALSLALNHRGKLYFADAASKAVVDEWKARHANTPDDAFELPDFMFEEVKPKPEKSKHHQMRDAINDVELALNALEVDDIVRRFEGADGSIVIKVPLEPLRRLAKAYPELNRIINDPAFETGD